MILPGVSPRTQAARGSQSESAQYGSAAVQQYNLTTDPIEQFNLACPERETQKAKEVRRYNGVCKDSHHAEIDHHQ